MHDVDLPQQVDRAKTRTTNIQPGDINNESEPEGGRGGVGNTAGGGGTRRSFPKMTHCHLEVARCTAPAVIGGPKRGVKINK